MTNEKGLYMSELTVDVKNGIDADSAKKIQAAVGFVETTGGRAVIAELERSREALAGEAGTEIVAG